ncbi:MAG: ABC transporter permease [Chitinophagales bacterium]|nr:ABC transporter permease [Chitinophagales bacterium]
MIKNYLLIAYRNLRKHRTYTALNIFGLGLSIACCILIFMLVRHHYSFDNFHKNITRTALIGTESKLEEVTRENSVPYPMSLALRQEYAFLEKTAMISARDNSLITISSDGQAPVKFQEEIGRAMVEPELFEIFDFPLIRGNLDDFRQPQTALLTEKMAIKYFGSTDAALNKTFKVNNRTDYRVVGVLRNFPENTDVGRHSIFTSWSTMTSDSTNRMVKNWGGINGGTHCFVKFREGYTAANLEAMFPAFREKYFHPEVREWWYHAVPMQAAHFDPDYGFGANKKHILALALIGIFLLITACVNFVNMATAQALNRAREVGVRKTMGSTRNQLFWQFIAETGLIVVFSTVIGLALAHIGLPKLNNLAGTSLAFNLDTDIMMFGFIAALMVVITFLAGAYPGLSLSGFHPAESLKSGSGSMQRAGGFSLRRILVGTQFAISQALIIAAVVVTAQVEYSQNTDLGFHREGIVNVGLPSSEPTQKSTLKQQLSAISGVEQVSLCFQPPASEGNWQTGVRMQGAAEYEPFPVNFKFIDEHYLETFELKLLYGRNVQPSDTIREFIVNEALMKKLGFNTPQEIVGKILDVDHRVFPIVGVVKDFHNRSFHEDINPQVFASSADNFDQAAIRLNGNNTAATLAAVEKTWSDMFPEYVFDSEFMDDQIARFYEQESVILTLVRGFAGIAVLIGCLGLYGLAAFMVTKKTKEIGIRKTLGASIPGILWLFGKEYFRLILLAFLIASPLARWAMNGWLEGYAYRISLGIGIFLTSLLATFGIALITVGVQSVRAALANPVQSLRSE